MSRAAQPNPTVQEAPEQHTSPPEKGELAQTLDRLDREKPIRVPVVEGRFCPDSLEGYQRLARAYILSDLIPFTFRGTGQNKRNETQLLACVTLVLAAGMGSLKLTPEQALAGMMVVNNRTALFGDALPALIRGSGKCLGIDERIVGEGDARVAVCKMTRLHRLPDGTLERETIERRFSVADAKVAKLWGKRGYEGKDTPWTTHPDRMLQMRARSFAARDGFADVLMGMGVVEELQDIEPETHQNGHAKAQDAQAAIDALKTGATPKDGLEAAGRVLDAQAAQRITTAPERPRTNGRPTPPAEPPAAQDAQEGQQLTQEDRDAVRQESEGDNPPDDDSQVTNGTDAETSQAQPNTGLQAAGAHNQTARRAKPSKFGPPDGAIGLHVDQLLRPKGIGDKDAQPPADMFEPQPAGASRSGPPARPWSKG